MEERMISATRIAERLERATSHKRLLEHPFYQAWAAGELTVEDLRHYSTQYWRQVENFPSYLRALAERLPEGAREIVESNLRDEVEDDHAGLWLRFAAAVRAQETVVRSSSVLPETQECIEAFHGSESRSAHFALGMIYGYESQTPGVAETKITGLKEHYGIEGPGVDYFKLHGELDVEHTAELAEAISLVTDDESALAEAEAGAAAGAEAIWRLLDGVERIRQEGLSNN
jgi:pyrroloquinoline-quinone synthase